MVKFIYGNRLFNFIKYYPFDIIRHRLIGQNELASVAGLPDFEIMITRAYFHCIG